jgi:hypothetical protein
MSEQETAHSERRRRAHSISSFCAQGEFSRSFFYNLPVEKRPHARRIGTRIMITESPRDWLERVGEPA